MAKISDPWGIDMMAARAPTETSTAKSAVYNPASAHVLKKTGFARSAALSAPDTDVYVRDLRLPAANDP